MTGNSSTLANWDGSLSGGTPTGQHMKKPISDRPSISGPIPPPSVHIAHHFLGHDTHYNAKTHGAVVGAQISAESTQRGEAPVSGSDSERGGRAPGTNFLDYTVMPNLNVATLAPAARGAHEHISTPTQLTTQSPAIPPIPGSSTRPSTADALPDATPRSIHGSSVSSKPSHVDASSPRQEQVTATALPSLYLSCEPDVEMTAESARDVYGPSNDATGHSADLDDAIDAKNVADLLSDVPEDALDNRYPNKVCDEDDLGSMADAEGEIVDEETLQAGAFANDVAHDGFSVADARGELIDKGTLRADTFQAKTFRTSSASPQARLSLLDRAVPPRSSSLQSSCLGSNDPLFSAPPTPVKQDRRVKAHLQTELHEHPQGFPALSIPIDPSPIHLPQDNATSSVPSRSPSSQSSPLGSSDSLFGTPPIPESTSPPSSVPVRPPRHRMYVQVPPLPYGNRRSSYAPMKPFPRLTPPPGSEMEEFVAPRPPRPEVRVSRPRPRSPSVEIIEQTPLKRHKATPSRSTATHASSISDALNAAALQNNGSASVKRKRTKMRSPDGDDWERSHASKRPRKKGNSLAQSTALLAEMLFDIGPPYATSRAVLLRNTRHIRSVLPPPTGDRKGKGKAHYFKRPPPKCIFQPYHEIPGPSHSSLGAPPSASGVPSSLPGSMRPQSPRGSGYHDAIEVDSSSSCGREDSSVRSRNASVALGEPGPSRLHHTAAPTRHVSRDEEMEMDQYMVYPGTAMGSAQESEYNEITDSISAHNMHDPNTGLGSQHHSPFRESSLFPMDDHGRHDTPFQRHSDHAMYPFHDDQDGPFFGGRGADADALHDDDYMRSWPPGDSLGADDGEPMAYGGTIDPTLLGGGNAPGPLAHSPTPSPSPPPHTLSDNDASTSKTGRRIGGTSHPPRRTVRVSHPIISTSPMATSDSENEGITAALARGLLVISDKRKTTRPRVLTAKAAASLDNAVSNIASTSTKLGVKAKSTMAPAGKQAARGRMVFPRWGVIEWCHHCRSQNEYLKMSCSNIKADGTICDRKFCVRCVLKRYPDVRFNRHAEDFVCPVCRDDCNCSSCAGKRGETYVREIEGGWRQAHGYEPLGDIESHLNDAASAASSPPAFDMQPEPARTFIPATADPETSGAGVYFSTVYGMDGEPMGVLGDIAADSSSIFSHPQRAQPISPIAGPSRSVSSHPPQAPPTHSHAKPRRRVWVGQVQRGWGLPAGARGKQFYAPGQEHQAKKRKGKGKEKMDPSQISTVRSYIGRKPPKIKPPTHDDDSSASEALSVSSCLTPLPEGYRDSPAPDYPEPAPDTGALTPWPNATLPENGLPNDVPVRGASEASSHISLETTEKGLQALAAEGVYGVTL